MKRHRSSTNRRIRKSNKFKRIMVAFLTWGKKLDKKSKIMILTGTCVLIAALVVVISVTAGADNNLKQASAAQVSSPVLPEEELSSADSAPTPTPTPIPTPTPTAAPTPTPTPDPTLQKGDENERVQKLQDRLMDLGYMDLDESTQLYGPATKYAVELFQRQHELQQDGIAGTETLSLIYSDESKKYTLLEGTSGRDVDSLQRQLISLGYLGKSTGYYGTETVEAVKAFQQRNDLEVDGKTGHYTLDMIYSPKAKPSKDKAQEERRRANILTVLDVAKKQLGDPYILGNEGPNSFDCSGLVYYCLKEAGSSRGRYNAAGYSQVSDWDKIKSMNDLEKGDLLFFWNSGKTKVGHVGIYVGSGMMIDASSSNGKVVKRSCKTSYWKKMFVFARRPW